MTKFFIASLVATMFLVNVANAATYIPEKDIEVHKVASNYGIHTEDLREMNSWMQDSMIKAGSQVTVISADDRGDAMAFCKSEIKRLNLRPGLKGYSDFKAEYNDLRYGRINYTGKEGGMPWKKVLKYSQAYMKRR
jgi:hypothetical protein